MKKEQIYDASIVKIVNERHKHGQDLVVNRKRRLFYGFIVITIIYLLFSFVTYTGLFNCNDNDNGKEFEIFDKLNIKMKSNEMSIEFKHKKFSMIHPLAKEKHSKSWFLNNQHKEINFAQQVHNMIQISKRNSFKVSISKSISSSIIDCFSINITNQQSSDDPVIGCFNLSSNYWYGGHESLDQPYWPINNMSYDYKAYITGYPDAWGAVLERYWLSSQGIALYMDQSVPLFVQHVDKNQICLMSNRNKLPYSNTPNYYAGSSNKLSYTMCSGPDIKTLHLHMINTYIGLPKSYPDETMIRSPVFTTWAYFFRNMNQTVVLDFAQQIAAHGYPRSQLEIDDQWEVHYGDLDFNREQFPNPKVLTDQLHALGFRVTLWVHPFCNIDSSNFINGTQNGYWIRDPSGNFPALTSWWNGRYAALLDTTNPNASDYFIEKLNNLKKSYGIDSFKFDAGESSWTPQQYSLFDSSANPNTYSTNYVRIAAKMGNFIEVRTGASTQDFGIFYRMLDRATDWSIDDGLKSVVTVALQFGILGYINVLPDIIFGNAGPDPSLKELFIRWTQLTAFLPVMQFGTPPWFFDKQTNDICLSMVKLHQALTPYIISQTRNLDGSPIVRPMWWNADDAIQFPQVYTMTDEFMVGDDIVVAPILDPGVSKRDIWLPSGKWIDQLSKIVYNGPLWLRDYNIVLENIPYFIRINGSLLI